LGFSASNNTALTAPVGLPVTGALLYRLSHAAVYAKKRLAANPDWPRCSTRCAKLPDGEMQNLV